MSRLNFECPLCKKQKSRKAMSRHHLTPVSVDETIICWNNGVLSQPTIEICKNCHTRVHQKFTNKQLADKYCEPQKLIEAMRITEGK